jgi:hypothetical protein
MSGSHLPLIGVATQSAAVYNSVGQMFVTSRLLTCCLIAWAQLTDSVTAAESTDIPPTLKQFDEEIQKYKTMEKAMKLLPASKNEGWIKIDAKPLKKALEGLVSKWSYLYIKYLQDKVVNEMDSLYSFMDNANSVLNLQVGKENLGEDEAAGAPETEEVPEGVDLAERRKAEEEVVCSKSLGYSCLVGCVSLAVIAPKLRRRCCTLCGESVVGYCPQA